MYRYVCMKCACRLLIMCNAELLNSCQQPLTGDARWAISDRYAFLKRSYIENLSSRRSFLQ